MPDHHGPKPPHRAVVREAGLPARLAAVRSRSLALVAGLSAEDMVVQSMPDASPVKWHLAHTTWFFETFILGPHAGLPPRHPDWGFLFNSYYEAAGPRHPRPHRGLLTRPTLAEVLDWRAEVDAALDEFLGGEVPEVARVLIELGLQHEEQHQELILTDVKHLLSCNPLRPAWRSTSEPAALTGAADAWAAHEGGLVEIGHDGAGFAFDNEGPRHRVWLAPFRIAHRPVRCAAWLDFMADGGYRTPSLWLSDGWATVQAEGWTAPLYWRDAGDGDWRCFTLAGERPVDPAAAVAHVSHYEADAFARWSGVRLPTEAEWETMAAVGLPDTGAVWEWTGSAYLPYPAYRPAVGVVGEYNGKFMSGQMVLRGGSIATAPGHARPTYRNFFPPAARWQFSGLRLARED